MKGWWLLLLLAHCRPSTDNALDTTPTPGPTPSAVPSAAPAAVPAPVPSAVPSASASPDLEGTAPPPYAFSAQDAHALTTLLQRRRVSRLLILGNMPAVRERHSWMLSDDGRELTLLCEHGDARLIVSGRPTPPRWYLVASVAFEAAQPPQARWATEYRRQRFKASPRVSRQTCLKVGERVALSCHPDSRRVLRPNAFVPVDTPAGAPVTWQPSARRRVPGLACSITAPSLSYYDFPADSGVPMLFFSDVGSGIERVVYVGQRQYADLRESAPWTPLDPTLPKHLR